MVQDLEREWDVSLLERGRRGVRPTSDGLALLPYAQRVCREYETLQEQIDSCGDFAYSVNRKGRKNWKTHIRH